MKRWLGLFAVLAVATVIVVVWENHSQAPLRQHTQFEKIEMGMTEEEVIELMGPPFTRHGAVNNPSWECLIWKEVTSEPVTTHVPRAFLVAVDVSNRRVTEKRSPRI